MPSRFAIGERPPAEARAGTRAVRVVRAAMRRTCSIVCALAEAAAVAAGSLVPAEATRAPDRFMKALAAYQYRKFGRADANARTMHVGFVATCTTYATGPRCPPGMGAYLVTYAVGTESAGEALILSKPCTVGHGTCLTVVTAGGGALGERELEDAGLSQARARTLLRR